MSSVTENLGKYIEEKGINIKDLSRSTGIPYGKLYTSLKSSYRDRDLRDIEFLAICQHLEVDPMRFAG
jgi:predicted transcriptional regulator